MEFAPLRQPPFRLAQMVGATVQPFIYKASLPLLYHCANLFK